MIILLCPGLCILDRVLNSAVGIALTLPFHTSSVLGYSGSAYYVSGTVLGFIRKGIKICFLGVYLHFLNKTFNLKRSQTSRKVGEHYRELDFILNHLRICCRLERPSSPQYLSVFFLEIRVLSKIFTVQPI